MNHRRLHLPATRREFLQRGGASLGLLAFSRFAPAFLTQTALAGTPAPKKDARILVLVQLAGGNDGLNTVIPCDDDRYYKLRPRLAVAKKDTRVLGENLAFPAACDPLAELHKNGRLSLIRNVGYPNPNRSHFRSSEIWETASGSRDTLGTGWIGRFLDNQCAGAPDQAHDPRAIHLSQILPQTFQSDQPHPVFGREPRARGNRLSDTSLLEKATGVSPAAGDNAHYLSHTLLDALANEKRVERIVDAYSPSAAYGFSEIGRSLQNVAALIASGMETRVYFVSHGGFDTHANQANTHERLLKELSQALGAFQKDLESKKLQDQILTMTFSEFGRRPSENASGGTDHGTAAPLFVMGSKLKDRVIGKSPDLNLAKQGDLAHETDFRAVYATVLQRWFECDPKAVLGGDFEPVNFI